MLKLRREFPNCLYLTWYSRVMTKIGHYIRHLRARAGITQAELAKSIGARQPEVARWESGRTTPNGETLLAIQRAMTARYGSPYDDMLGAAPYSRPRKNGSPMDSYIAMIEKVRTRPISEADRDELATIQEDLQQRRDRVDAILSKYDLDTLLTPIDNNLLNGIFGPFSLSLTPGPTAIFTLGTSDIATPVTVDLDNIPHGMIVYGMTPYGERIGAQIASDATKQDPREVEIWNINLASFTIGALTINTTNRTELQQYAAEALRTAYHERIHLLDRTDNPNFASYWKYQQKNPAALRMRRVLLIIDRYETFCHSQEFQTALAEVFAHARTLGIHVQLYASVFPTGIGDRIYPHLGYFAVLHDDNPDTYTRTFPTSVRPEIRALPTEPGSGLLYTTASTPALTRFRCTTEEPST